MTFAEIYCLDIYRIWSYYGIISFEIATNLKIYWKYTKMNQNWMVLDTTLHQNVYIWP